MSEWVFVYGSLRRGAPGGMSRLLQPGSRPGGRARVRGRLLDLGAWPGLVADVTGWVQGELHHLRDPDQVLARLDCYEGCASGQPTSGFQRIEMQAFRSGGRAVRAWAYVYTGTRAGRAWMISGDWLRRGR